MYYPFVYFLPLLIALGCSGSPNTDINTTEKEIDYSKNQPEEDTLLKKIENIGFKNLVSRFQITSLPFYYGYESPLDVKFDSISLNTNSYVYEHLRLPIDTAVLYFLGGNKELNNQPSGGIYEYYYGYRLPSNGDFILLFYYRPSGDEYSYRLASFGIDGQIIDDIGLVGGLGQFDPETQRECLINTNWTIQVEELEIDNTSVKRIGETEDYQYKVTRTDIEYEIASDGRFKEIKRQNLGDLFYLEKKLEKGGYKLYAPNSVSSLFR